MKKLKITVAEAYIIDQWGRCKDGEYGLDETDQDCLEKIDGYINKIAIKERKKRARNT